MKQYKFTTTIDINTAPVKNCLSDMLYFDIETTGLSAKKSDLYMIGYATLTDCKTASIFLLFNDDGCSEEEILTEFAGVAKNYTQLISYNGDTFDIPYLKEKYRQFQIESCLEHLESLDIYRRIRKYKKLFHLNSMRQSDIEELNGICRDSFISGGELISQYKLFLKNGDMTILDNLLTHNKDDIAGLLQISDTLNVDCFLNGAFQITTIELDEEFAVFRLNIPFLPFRITYGTDGAFFLNAYKNSATLKLHLLCAKLKYFYADYKNYYYLPVEDMAIHKSVAAYVDNAHKVKATKATAYLCHEGLFVRQTKKPVGKIYKQNLEDKISYMELSNQTINDLTLMKEYVTQLLRELV